MDARFASTRRALGALLLTTLALGFTCPAAAEDASRANAQKMVEAVMSMHRSAGPEKTLAAISTKEGPFHKGELYAFAYNTRGEVVAHPVNAKLIGKNMIDVPDPDGKLFRKVIVEMALAKGGGVVDYKYKNPTNGKMEPKLAFFQRAGEIIYLCGAYGQ
jgi:signal transduction histidine kinase